MRVRSNHNKWEESLRSDAIQALHAISGETDPNRFLASESDSRLKRTLCVMRNHWLDLFTGTTRDEVLRAGANVTSKDLPSGIAWNELRRSPPGQKNERSPAKKRFLVNGSQHQNRFRKHWHNNNAHVIVTDTKWKHSLTTNGKPWLTGCRRTSTCTGCAANFTARCSTNSSASRGQRLRRAFSIRCSRTKPGTFSSASCAGARCRWGAARSEHVRVGAGRNWAVYSAPRRRHNAERRKSARMTIAWIDFLARNAEAWAKMDGSCWWSESNPGAPCRVVPAVYRRNPDAAGPSYRLKGLAGWSNCRRFLDELYRVCTTGRLVMSWYWRRRAKRLVHAPEHSPKYLS